MRTSLLTCAKKVNKLLYKQCYAQLARTRGPVEKVAGKF